MTSLKTDLFPDVFHPAKALLLLVIHLVSNEKDSEMISVNEITKKLERLPYNKQVAVFEFIDFLEQKTRHGATVQEMNDAEVLMAAEQTGSFAFLDDPSEDIYTIADGEAL
ncbi:MAG: hypothetical protein WA081_02365 [Desulfosalsimonadaceae bacterium]